MSKAKEDAVTEFKASKQYTDLLDANYAVGFEDFRAEAMENFPEVDFSFINLTLLLPLAPFFKLALRTLMWKTMLALSHPMTTPMLMPPLLKDETFYT